MVPVAQRVVPVYGQYVGQTEAVSTVEIRARVEGFLERQVVPDGANVKAGDLLNFAPQSPITGNSRGTRRNRCTPMRLMRSFFFALASATTFEMRMPS